VKVAVDREFVSGDHRLADGAEVALIPPVSGGAPACSASPDEPLDLAEVGCASGSAPTSTAAIATFTGRGAQPQPRQGPIVRLEYEAYRPMAVAQAWAEIAARIAEESCPGVPPGDRATAWGAPSAVG